MIGVSKGDVPPTGDAGIEKPLCDAHRTRNQEVAAVVENFGGWGVWGHVPMLEIYGPSPVQTLLALGMMFLSHVKNLFSHI